MLFEGYTDKMFLIIQHNLSLVICFLLIIVAYVALYLLPVIIKKVQYKNSQYYNDTNLPYSLLKNDVGKWGEYLTYCRLRKFESKGARFLFNSYIPKMGGGTSEIDIMMISHKGIFVYESKNYGGWIFGGLTQKNWYQTFPKGRGKSHKEVFYNPIMQNQAHVKHLQSLLNKDAPIRSIVVFSDKCTLKNTEIHSTDVRVIKREDVYDVTLMLYDQIQNDVLTSEEIDDIYNALYPYTQVDEQTKGKAYKGY